MVLFLRSTFQSAVREGVRYAITGANSPGPGQDDSIKAVVKVNALGFLNGATAASKIHVHWIDPVTGAVANNSMGNLVEVSVEAYQYSELAPYLRLGFPVKVWARAYDVMQFIPGTLPPITNLE